MSFDTEVHNIYSPKYSTENSEGEHSEEKLVCKTIKAIFRTANIFPVPFLKKVQSIESKIESLQSKSTTNYQSELKSQRETFKQPSLFSKGPIMAHHRSLALSSSNKDQKQSSSVIQNCLAVEFINSKHKMIK